jgi:hypothetical protein
MRSLLNFVLEITDIAGKCKKPAADVSNIQIKERPKRTRSFRFPPKLLERTIEIRRSSLPRR